MQVHQLQEWREQAYESSKLYKERTKRIHDSKLKGNKEFKAGDQVLLYNSRLHLFPGKLRSRWSGPFTVTQVFSHGAVEITRPDEEPFKVNGHRLKMYVTGAFLGVVEEMKLDPTTVEGADP